MKMINYNKRGYGVVEVFFLMPFTCVAIKCVYASHCITYYCMIGLMILFTFSR